MRLNFKDMSDPYFAMFFNLLKNFEMVLSLSRSFFALNKSMTNTFCLQFGTKLIFFILAIHYLHKSYSGGKGLLQMQQESSFVVSTVWHFFVIVKCEFGDVFCVFKAVFDSAKGALF